VPTLPDTDVVFLKEGVLEDTVPFDPAAPNGIQAITWSGVAKFDELNGFEIRSASGTFLAIGLRNSSFPEPVEVEEPILPYQEFAEQTDYKPEQGPVPKRSPCPFGFAKRNDRARNY